MQDTSKYRILVVDDEMANRRLAQVQVGLLGYACDTASDGGEALQAVQKQRYSLILMDLDMPKMDGLTATRAIRTWESTLDQSQRVPIIAFSAYVHDIDMHDCLEAGMDDGMMKPPEGEEFAEKLRYWVARSRSV